MDKNDLILTFATIFSIRQIQELSSTKIQFILAAVKANYAMKTKPAASEFGC